MDMEAEGARACQAGQAALAVRLVKRLADKTNGSNLVFSPLSIYTSVAMLSAGACGRTLDELLGVLGVPSLDELPAFVRSTVRHVLADRSATGGPCVAFAAGVWSDARWLLKPAYRNVVVGYYNGGTWTVDFREKAEEAREQIHEWVAEVTRNLITSVLPEGSPGPDTVLVKANAVYFKGQWLYPFSDEDTQEKQFHRLDGSSVDVPFMQSWRPQFISSCSTSGGLRFQVLKLPYKMHDCLPSDDFSPCPECRRLPLYSMCVFLPEDRDGLWSMLAAVTPDPEFLKKHLQMVQVAVGKFRIPKFKLVFTSMISGVLKELGMELPFDKENADLSDMVEDGRFGAPPIFVHEVVHKTVVEVNEEGTEVAAATESDDEMGFSLEDSYVLPKLVDFVADHPFAFFIVEEVSGAIVFSGHVLDPSCE